MNRNKLLLVGGVGAAGVLAVVYFTSRGSSSSAAGAQTAVNPNAQVGAGAYAQGTLPDIGNLLSYNQMPGVISAPQATSVTGDPTSVMGGPSTMGSQWVPFTTPGMPATSGIGSILSGIQSAVTGGPSTMGSQWVPFTTPGMPATSDTGIPPNQSSFPYPKIAI